MGSTNFWDGSSWTQIFDRVTANDIEVGAVGAEHINSLNPDVIPDFSILSDKILLANFTNVIDDGDFVMSSGSPWSGGVLVPDPYFNQYQLTLTGTTGEVVNSTRLSVTSGIELPSQIELYLPTTNTSTPTVTMRVRFYDQNDVETIVALDDPLVTTAALRGSWNTMSATITVPEDAIEAKFSVYVSGGVSGNVIKFRRAYMYRSKQGQIYVDGNVIARGSITAESGIIKSLDANAITTGTIDAERISILPKSKISGLSSDIDGINTSIADTNAAVAPILNAIQIDGEGIKIGQAASAEGQTNFSVKLDYDSLDFMEDSVVVAQVTSRRLWIRDADIATTPGTSLLLGAHQISIGGTGSFLNKVTVVRGV